MAPDELPERLERALASAPPAGDDVSERALAAALAALPPAAEQRPRRRGRLLLVPAAAAIALAFAGVTLAASTGRLPLVSDTAHHRQQPPQPSAGRHRPPDPLPRGAVAFSAAAGGRVWLATSSGFRLQGRALGAIAASPGAVNAVEAGRGYLRAVRLPDGRVAFTHRLAGTGVAAGWAPAGIRIAYVVRARGHDRLYDMWGNGRNRFLVAPRTSGAAPSWRWDSQAFAFIRADGRVMVHDVIGGRTAPVAVGCGIRHAVAVAFSPYGGDLAVADRSGRVAVVATLGGGGSTCARAGAGGVPKLAWLRPGRLIVAAGATLTRLLGPGVDVTAVPGQVAGIASAPGGRLLALALRDASGDVRVVEARTPRFSEAAHPLRVYRVLLHLGRVDGPVTLGWQ